jgi:vacuolar-type H+-ATPase subunit I/STV1
MSYVFEAELISKLKNYDNLSSQIKILSEQKDKIRDQIKKWREVNNIQEKVNITEGNDSWIIDVFSQHRRNIRDYDVLIRKLGDDASVFIEEKDIETMRITKR